MRNCWFGSPSKNKNVSLQNHITCKNQQKTYSSKTISLAKTNKNRITTQKPPQNRADLWTGSIQLLNISLLSPKTRLVDIIHTFKILVVSFIGNFCGATFVAFFFCYLINMHSTEPWVAFLKAYGEKKTSKEPWFLFISAIGCNILVNTAYFMSIVAGDVSGKLLSVLAGVSVVVTQSYSMLLFCHSYSMFFVTHTHLNNCFCYSLIFNVFFCYSFEQFLSHIQIGTFVTIGFEHVVANMFFLPAAAFFGANFPVWKLFFWNIAVVAFGNYIGGVFLFGLTLWYGHVYRPAHKSCFYNLYSTSARRFAKARGNGAENTTNTFHIATSHDQDISARELEEHPLQPTATATAVPTQFQV